MCEKEIQLIAIICLFDFVCGTQNLFSSFDFQKGHLDNPDIYIYLCVCATGMCMLYLDTYIYIYTYVCVCIFIYMYI